MGRQVAEAGGGLLADEGGERAQSDGVGGADAGGHGAEAGGGQAADQHGGAARGQDRAADVRDDPRAAGIPRSDPGVLLKKPETWSDPNGTSLSARP